VILEDETSMFHSNIMLQSSSDTWHILEEWRLICHIETSEYENDLMYWPYHHFGYTKQKPRTQRHLGGAGC